MTILGLDTPPARQLLTIFQVDAFAEETYCGNPAAIVRVPHGVPATPPYDLDNPPKTGEAEQEWLWPGLSVDSMQKIANEKNLSETAFYVIDQGKTVEDADGKTLYAYLRWFTPSKEVQLCGHGTLATAYAIFRFEPAASGKNRIVFTTKYKGHLEVQKGDVPLWEEAGESDTAFPVGVQVGQVVGAGTIAAGDRAAASGVGSSDDSAAAVERFIRPLPLKMRLPLDETKPLVEDVDADGVVFHDDAASTMTKWDGLRTSCFQEEVRPKSLLRSRQEKQFDHVLVFETAEEIANLEPNHEALKKFLPKNEGCRALICTAPGGAGRRILENSARELQGGAASQEPPSKKQRITAAEDRHCVSRVFAPNIDVPEDPVTGSAHATIASYWCCRLGLEAGTSLRARQIHPTRSGGVECEWAEGQATVTLTGTAVLVEVGAIVV